MMLLPFLLPLLGVSLACQLPSQSLQWLPSSHPPCYHVGQAMVALGDDCADVRIRSRLISLSEDGEIFAEASLCMYDRPLMIRYEASRDGGKSWEERWLRLAHPRASVRRREKRWLRRRNPATSLIHFQQEKYVKEIKEDAETGTLLLTVKASHATDEPLFYSMAAPLDSRSADLFTLHAESGAIHLAKSLDRETLEKHVLKVTAYERLNPSVSSSTTIHVDVLDVQDNSPVFERDSYFAETREDAPVGTTVLSVFARDKDSGANGEIAYSLDPSGEGAHLLSVNPATGVVQTAAPLDRESLPVMRLSVVATDKGDPPRSAAALIELTLLDVNDNAPLFEKEVYNVSVLENTTLPAIIAVVSAMDADAGPNGEVHYSLASSTSLPVSVDYSTGEVSLRSRLPLSDTAFSLLIRAKDGASPAKSSTVALYINVIDINDHAPVFVAAQRMIVVEEGHGPGDEVAKVYAIDEDIGDNARIRYTLKGTDDFEICPESGVIRSVTLIDRERTARYDLVITATDGGDPALSATTEMTIIVKDVNDNAPVFEKNYTLVSLSEDSALGQKVALLRATDADEDNKLSYRIERTSADVFSLIDMGSEGALLSVRSSLKHGGRERIEVEVSAADQGGLKGTAIVEVVVEDVNSAPSFLPQPFSVRIPEDSSIGTPVITMKAEDTDRGENALVTYTVSDDSDGHFAINSTNGLITVAAPLDRETRSSYLLAVTAADAALPPLSTTTSIEIIIDDVNDNAPAFTSSNYAAAISEDVPIGTSFLQVSAVDGDEGENALIDYYLNESAPVVKKDLFRLDRTSGTLRVNGRLDRETLETIQLPIYARDRGNPSKSSSSMITVTLTDVNDNAPKFEQSSYDLSLAENSPAGTLVGTITATDADQGDNAKIEFRIFGGSDAKHFDILVDEAEPNAVKILSRTPFDYESKTTLFHVEIQATSGQLSSTALVRIRLSDVNDNRPSLRDFLVYVVAHEEKPPRGEIGSVPAFDADASAALTYSIDDNELLVVEKDSGRLSLKREWRGGLDAKLKVCVSDGPNTVCAQCRLIFVRLRAPWLTEANTVTLGGVNEDSFWDPAVFARFRQAISALADWLEGDVIPLSVNSSPGGGSIDVSFIVRHKQRVVRWWKVRDLLEKDRRRVERLAQMKVSWRDDESCAKEPCPFFAQCRNTLKFLHENKLHETDSALSSTLRTLHTFSCECPQGFAAPSNASEQCSERVDMCYSSPCANNGSCFALESGYRCECAAGWRGDRCEIPLRSLTCLPGYCKGESRCGLRDGTTMVCHECPYDKEETDERCSLRSISVDGKGMVRVERQLGRMQWRVSLRVATIQRDGILLFAGDRKSDFFEVSIEDRLPRVEYSVGGGTRTSVVKLKDERSNRINDGDWHILTVDYYERRVRLSLDDCDFAISGRDNEPHCAAEGMIALPDKCKDALVPCFRFLDVPSSLFIGGRPSTEGKEIIRPFGGCLADVVVDGERVDFADGDVTERIGLVHDGCGAKSSRCSESSCPSSSLSSHTSAHSDGRCRERWGGVQCLPHCRKGGHAGCGASYSLFDDESFLVWRPEEAVEAPFHLHFNFRATRTNAQLLAVEFNVRTVFFSLHVEDGGLRASLGSSNSTILSSPEISPAHWTKVAVDVREDDVAITIDDLYTTTLPLPQEVAATLFYTGLAPSTNHPSQFEGCLRGMMLNGEELHPSLKGKIRDGCSAADRCLIEGVCPKDARCIREWDKHRCECHTGFVGDSCRPVCSFDVCGRGGLCLPSNNSRGYECECGQDRSGANCEYTRPQHKCPRGWFGVFPHCKECQCDASSGFLDQCHEITGRCMCRREHFQSNGRCIACGCGPASSSPTCSASGQCTCIGEATGLKCDRCRSPFSQLNSDTGRCAPLHGQCPSQNEEGVHWSTTRKGVEARAGCPAPQTGVASRRCGSDSLWKEVQRFNCTHPAFNELLTKMHTSSTQHLVHALANATSDSGIIEGRNLVIARDIFQKIVGTTKEETLRDFISDEDVVESLTDSASALLQHSPSRHFLEDLTKILRLGRQLAKLHGKVAFLPAIQQVAENLLLGIDDGSSTRPLPRFDTFIDTCVEGFPDAAILPSRGGKKEGKDERMFFLIAPPLGCGECESAVVGIGMAGDTPRKSIRVSLPLPPKMWKFPECAVYQKGSWKSEGAALISQNSSHALCEFDNVEEALVTIVASREGGALIMLSAPTLLPVAISIVLLLLSVLVTLCRANASTRLIRIGFSLSLIVEALAVFAIHKVTINEIFCPARNALLSLATSSPFAWLFLYALHIYRLLSDGTDEANALVCLLVGVVFPSLFSAGTFFLSPTCSLEWNSWLFWALLAPIAVFLLLSFYSSATSLLLSGDKQYEMFVVGHRLRRALLQHAILSAMTLGYTVVSILLMPWLSSKAYSFLLSNVLLGLVAIATLLWSYTLSGARRDTDSPIYGGKGGNGGLWLDGRREREDEAVDGRVLSPLIDHGEGDEERRWMPDVVPPIAASPRGMSTLTRPPPTILSPATHILNGGAAAIHGTSPPPNYANVTGTIAAFHRQHVDDMDDAYAEYSSKFYSSTFSRR